MKAKLSPLENRAALAGQKRGTPQYLAIDFYFCVKITATEIVDKCSRGFL